MIKPAKPQMSPIYYDGHAGCYWLRFGSGPFVRLDGRSVKIQLLMDGQNTALENEIGLKYGDHVLGIAQRERAVDYAGPLAGHRAGLVEANGGKRVLVTSEIAPPVAKKGDCDWWDKFLLELLGPDQTEQFIYWLKCAVDSLQSGIFQPGQFLLLAGPSGCGKSLLQSLITVILGGRVAKPFRYFSGGTQFNSELAGAEHWMIADEAGSIDIRARRDLGENLKAGVANSEMSIHAKYGEAATLATFRRITGSVNNQPESLMVWPPINDSLIDKITLLLCSPANVGSDRAATWKAATGEIPALLDMLRRIRIPKRFKCDRYGVKSYQHPELFEMMSDYSPEARLLNMIDGLMTDGSQAEWEGPAIQIELKLRSSDFGFAADKLFSHNNACGTYLERLRKKYPERVASKKSNGQTVWTIQPPAEGADHPIRSGSP